MPAELTRAMFRICRSGKLGLIEMCYSEGVLGKLVKHLLCESWGRHFIHARNV